MLKRVVFILKEENIVQKMHSLLDELDRHQIEVYLCNGWGRENGGDDFNIEKRCKQNLSENAGETLYITDCPECHQKLQSGKLPVVVYLHENNRGETFSHAEYAIENLNEIEYQSLELAYLRLTDQPWVITVTKRCMIRESVIEDVDSFYEIYKDPSITEYMEDLYADRDEEAAYLRDYIKRVYGFYGYGMWTVLERKSGQVIGRAGISLREGSDIPELGFVIGVPWQRQGYAYEVCQAILAYGREELYFTHFQTLVMKGNEKSKKLCEKLGFIFEEDVEIDGVVYERMEICYED